MSKSEMETRLNERAGQIKQLQAQLAILKEYHKGGCIDCDHYEKVMNLKKELTTAKEENERLRSDIQDIKLVCDTYNELGTIFDENPLGPMATIVVGIVSELLGKNLWIPVKERRPEVGKQIIVMWKLVKLRFKPSIVKVDDTWPDPDSYTHWRLETIPKGEPHEKS